MCITSFNSSFLLSVTLFGFLPLEGCSTFFFQRLRPKSPTLQKKKSCPEQTTRAQMVQCTCFFLLNGSTGSISGKVNDIRQIFNLLCSIYKIMTASSATARSSINGKRKGDWGFHKNQSFHAETYPCFYSFFFCSHETKILTPKSLFTPAVHVAT
jgi:hypothetical protein